MKIRLWPPFKTARSALRLHERVELERELVIWMLHLAIAEEEGNAREFAGVGDAIGLLDLPSFRVLVKLTFDAADRPTLLRLMNVRKR